MASTLTRPREGAVIAGVCAGLAERFEEYQDPRNPSRSFIALVDGRIVGASTAVAADDGVNLFGTCGQNQNGHARHLADAAANFKAIEAGKHDIE